MGFHLCRPRSLSGRAPVYLHIHGGGYVFGNASMCGPQNISTALEVGCVVVSVDYRLAPETRHPGAVEDCYAVLRWLNANADALDIDPSRVAVGGESAGGGLAAALALLVRDRGELALCFQLLLAPMLDDRSAVDGHVDALTGEFVFARANNHFSWACALGHPPGEAEVAAYAVPGRVDDLSRLPPAYIYVGALDLFRDESIAYAQRLWRGGVPAELHVLPGAYHGFERSPEARVVREAIRESRAALARALRGPDS